MKRPWQNWLLMLLCVTIVVPAMGWMTLKALEIDRARRQSQQQTEEARRKEAEARRQAEIARGQADLARREAELQELISSALWRMDWTLTPLVAQEAARPYFAFQPFYAGTAYAPGGEDPKVAVQQLPSPLLVQPSKYVLLHFQIGPDGRWTSPQSPTGASCEIAVKNGTPLENIRLSADLLQQLSAVTNREDLLARLPHQLLPAVEVSKGPWNDNLNNWPANNWTFNYTGQTLQQEPPSSLPGDAHRAADVPADRQENPPATGGENQAETRVGGGGQQANAQASDQLAVTRQQIKQRDDKELEIRNRAYQSFFQNQMIQQRVNAKLPEPARRKISEGQCRAIWVGDSGQPRLLLARRVLYNDQNAVQGCWLNWPMIKQMLLEEVVDLFPTADLAPLDSAGRIQPGRRLATLPVQLVVPEPVTPPTIEPFDLAEPMAVAEPTLSPLQFSLILAWACLLAAMLAAVLFLRGVVSLSERRGAFVSAVTHELRTPLTTFRMYAEMLSEGMVREPAQRQQYVETLRVEADRLYHLVENVLAYARLERGRLGRREHLEAVQLIQRFQPRLADRASQAEMQLEVEVDESAQETTLFSDPAAVEQIVFNLVDNACKYANGTHDRRILVTLSADASQVQIGVRDHGPGMSPRERSRLFRPFSKSADEAARTAPGVGLGLALCRRLARALGGHLELQGTDGGASFLLILPRQ